MVPRGSMENLRRVSNYMLFNYVSVSSSIILVSIVMWICSKGMVTAGYMYRSKFWLSGIKYSDHGVIWCYIYEQK